MTTLRLITRSLRFHWRSHVGVLLGAAIGSATLIGALVVGDSVKESLRERAEARLGTAELALSTGDRLFGEDLLGKLGTARPGTARGNRRDDPAGAAMQWGGMGESGARALVLEGVASRQDGSARAHQVQVVGVSPGFWNLALSRVRGSVPPAFVANGPMPAFSPAHEAAFHAHFGSLWKPAAGGVRINAALARQLKVGPGDTLILRFAKPSALSQEAVLSPQDDARVAMRLVVEDVVSGEGLGDFSLKSGQRPVLNAFVNEEELWRQTGTQGRANLMLIKRGQEVSLVPGWKARFRAWLYRPGPVPVGSFRATADKWLGRLWPEPPLTPAATTAVLSHVTAELANQWRVSDGELEVRAIEEPVSRTGGEWMSPMIEVASRRVFLDSAVERAALAPAGDAVIERLPFLVSGEPDRAGASAFLTNGAPILTYLANGLRSGSLLTPYSMVTAAGAPWTPPGMRDDEIVVNEWLARDLALKPGDSLELTYFDPEAGSRRIERTNVFTVRSVVPLKGVHADRTLMPEFPGLAKAESTSDWDAGFPLSHRIREQDEAYWKNHRGTPKAFVTLAAGRRMWANRFGDSTAIRFRVPEGAFASTYVKFAEANVQANLKPADLGFVFRPVRGEALTAAASGQDFGGLFLGFSFFLMAGALLLMALLFRFGLEQRLPEIGTLLAVGFARPQVLRLWFCEGLVLSLLGAVVGSIGGLMYASAMVHGLRTLWSDAVAGTPVFFHVTPETLIAGLTAATVVCAVTLWMAMRRQFRRPVRVLMSGDIGDAATSGGGRGRWVGWGTLAGAGILTVVALSTGRRSDPGLFFGAGSLVLISGLGFLAAALRRSGGKESESAAKLSFRGLAVRGTARRRSRSLATVALLASGTFLISALGVFRLDAGKDAERRNSGTGGFALMAESSLAVSEDLNSAAGLEQFGLGPEDLKGAQFVPFRVRDGDDASCLNLDRAQRPRLLGVRPDHLATRGAFRWGGWAQGFGAEAGWMSLTNWSVVDGAVAEIPAIGDAASIQWALGKKLGDAIEITDERGRKVRLRIVAGVVNSILQGSLVVDELALMRLFPGTTGYRSFFIDVESGRASEVTERLSRALSDVGLEVTATKDRLAQLNAVQNTYLGTFQILGGLGLLLGSAGLGVVVLRNVLERRGELALLEAVGFPAQQVSWLVLAEHLALLGLGLALGVVSAALAVTPALAGGSGELPIGSLGMTLSGVCLVGIMTAWTATRVSVGGSLLAALRGE